MGFSIKALAQQVAAEVAADEEATVTRGNHNTGTRHGGQSITNGTSGGGDHVTVRGRVIEGDYVAGRVIDGNKTGR